MPPSDHDRAREHDRDRGEDVREPPSAADRAAAAAAGRSLMAEGADRLIDGVERLGAGWVVRQVTELLDAWGRLDAEARAAAVAAAAEGGARASERVVAELHRLFELDPADQRSTPLEVIRSLRREATDVLAAAGVPEVERDPFEARAFPDDVYGIVLKTPAELGDDELGGALLAWGLGKAKVLRART